MTSATNNTPKDILLVEDSIGDARLTQEVFRDGTTSPTLHIVRDGREALDFLHRQGDHIQAPRPDLILLDLNLPKLDGREVLAQIKSDPELMKIPVIVMSTSQSPADIEKCYRLYVNCFVSKPVEIDEFTDLVRMIESFWLSTVKLPSKD